MDTDLPSLSAAETQPAAVPQQTQRLQSSNVPTLPLGVLPGQRFGECLQNSPLVETWKTQALDGKPQLVQFVYGCTLTDSQKLQELAAHLTSLQHPGILSTQIVHVEPGRFILKIPLVQETLRDRFVECQRFKQPGIMRTELVDYVRAAAEILDYLYQQHSVQHLGLNPRARARSRLAAAGRLRRWPSSSGCRAGKTSPSATWRYAAPELFERHLSRSADQYSLALIYAELLTGQHPFPTQEKRHQGQPDLSKLSVQDRDIIARALDPDPARRWPSATEMALALEGSPLEAQREQCDSDPFLQLLKQPATGSLAHTIPDDLRQRITDLLISLVPRKTIRWWNRRRSSMSRNNGSSTASRSVCRWAPHASNWSRSCRNWAARCCARTTRTMSCACRCRARFGQRFCCQEPAVEARIELRRVHAMSATPVELLVRVSARHLEREQTLKILEQKGLDVVDKIRNHLLVGSEKRMQDRMLWPHPLQIVPVHADGRKDEPIECRGKDISFTGLGLYVPHELDTCEVILQGANSVHPPTLEIPATLVGAHRGADGWYDVGALFHLPALRKSLPETCLP